MSSGCEGCEEPPFHLRLPRVGGLPKSFFLGDDLQDPSDDPTFYARFALSNDPAVSLTPGSATPLMLVKWEITEDLLLARSVAGSNTGLLVAAFPILEHHEPGKYEAESFDPWQQRPLMQVDFSRNLNGEGYETLSDATFIDEPDAISFEPLAYQVDAAPNDAASPQILLDQGYIAVSNAAYATPALVYVPEDLTTLPSWLTSGIFRSETDELRIRLSFLRVDATDYQPLPWNDARDRAAGAGSITIADELAGMDQRLRTRADPSKTIVWHYTRGSDPSLFDSTREAVSAWDIALRVAERSAQYADCSAAGSDLADCTQEHPVIRSQVELEDAIALGGEVDQCLRAGSGPGAPHSLERQDACLASAASLGEQRGVSGAVVSIATAPPKMVLCNAPVTVYDDPRCVVDHQKRLSDARRAIDDRRPLALPATAAGCAQAWDDPFADTDATALCNAAFYADPGDLRFFTITVSPSPSATSWSTVSRAADPLSGEIVAADIRIWAAPSMAAAQHAAELLIPSGPSSLDAQLDALGIDALAALRFDAASLERRDIAIADGRSLEQPDAGPLLGFSDLPSATRADAVAAIRSLAGVRSTATETPSDMSLFEGRMGSGRDTPTEALSITTPVLRVAGFSEDEVAQAASGLGGGFANGFFDYASFFRLGDPRKQRFVREKIAIARAERGASYLDARESLPSPRSVALLKPLIEDALGAPPASDSGREEHRAEISRLLVARLHRQLTLHQMGSALGLAANYGGSADALGYRPQYWQLRTRNGSVTAACSPGLGGADCVGPRSLDAPTAEERAQLSDSLFAQSTVMDTPGDPIDAFATLGSYDVDALRLLYFDVASVGLGFDPESFEPSAEGTLDDPAAALLLDLHGRGGALGLRSLSATGEALSYADLARELDLVRSCREVDVEAFRPKIANIAWHPLLDGGLVEIDGVTTRCEARPSDFVHFNSLLAATPAQASGTISYADQAVVDPRGRIRVATLFGDELSVDRGNALIWRGDRGADRSEIVAQCIADRHAEARFESAWLAAAALPAEDYVHAAWRLHLRDGPLRGAAVGLAAARAQLELALDADSGAVGASLRALAADDVRAAGLAFDELARRIFQPLSGNHVELDEWPAPAGSPAALEWQTPFLRSVDYADGEFSSAFALPSGLVRFPAGFTWGGGGVWRDPLALGFEKAYAAGSIWERNDQLVDRNGQRVDVSAVALSDAFPEAARRVLAAGVAGDYSGLPRVASIAGEPLLTKDGIPRRGVSRTSWTTAEPELCFPGSGAMSCSAYRCQSGCDHGSRALPLLTPDVPGAPEADTLLESFDDSETYRTLLAASLLRVPPADAESWADQLRLTRWDGDGPVPSSRIELHVPQGDVWVAGTFGTEVLFGVTVQRGVAARLLERLNDLARAAFHCSEVEAPTGTGAWCLPELVGDSPRVRFDPRLGGPAGCSAVDDSGCACSDNRACVAYYTAVERVVALDLALRDLGFDDD